MRRLRVWLLPAALAASSGCGYVHFGRLPEATAAAGGEAGMAAAYSNLLTEQKILKQELVLARKEGDVLRAAADRGTGVGATELSTRLSDTSRELAALRTNYARLQAEQAAGKSGSTSGAQLSDLEEKLATTLRSYTDLQAENGQLRADLDRTRRENLALTDQLKAAARQGEQMQATLAQLNTELLAQKMARAQAEQAAGAAQAQLSAVVAARPGPAAEGAAGGMSSLEQARAPTSEASPTAQLRTNSERLDAAAAALAHENPPTAGRRVHTVEQGDTLESIAQKYYGNTERWTRIYAANNDLLREGRPLKPGMELVIPD